jgi:hypothetical protein
VQFPRATHLPLYRQEDEAARHGLLLRRSTLCDWVAAAADLVGPLYLWMGQLVLRSRVVHTDDTKVKLLDPSLRQARTARFWAYIGDADFPYTVYDFTTSRQRDGPAKFLAGFRGYLQADAAWSRRLFRNGRCGAGSAGGRGRGRER